MFLIGQGGMRMRLRKIGFAAVSMMMVLIAAGCQADKKGAGDMLAHFAFDEKGGTVISDRSEERRGGKECRL